MGFALSWIRIGRRGGVCLNCGLELGFEREETEGRVRVRGSEKDSASAWEQSGHASRLHPSRYLL
jgi:hypothetical protein